MPEGCWFVAFDQVMSGPGKAVRDQRPAQRKPRMSDHKRHDERTQSEHGPGRVHGPVPRITVLMQVEGKELVVIGKLRLGHGHRSSGETVALCRRSRPLDSPLTHSWIFS